MKSNNDDDTSEAIRIVLEQVVLVTFPVRVIIQPAKEMPC